MSDYDDSDYEYFSDNEYNEYNEYEETSDSELEEKPSVKLIDDIKIIPIDILTSVDTNNFHYKWIIACLKVYYNINNESICQYNYDKEPLNLYLLNGTPSETKCSNGNYKFKLFIDSNKSTFPDIPFKICNVGDKLNIYDELVITKNTLIYPSNWNICTDVLSIVYNILHIMNKYTTSTYGTEIINNETDKAFKNISNQINLDLKFENIIGNNNLDLPAFGVYILNNTKNSTYSWKGSDSNNSITEIINNDINTLINNIEDIKLNETYIKLVHIILSKILEVQITELEYNMNQEFYNNIFTLVKETNYEYDYSFIDNFNTNKINNELCELVAETTEKLSFVDDFKYHKFKDILFQFTPKLTKRIYSEIKNIKDTISDFECYVLISENNINLLKLLFIPDSDTPYAYGFFEFDMYIPIDYPNSPPSVKFLTTGNGKVRFNPNLYNCGKVCLSIINTWSTPQWNPKSSTISQIILSISSMIFNEHPMTNEPSDYDCLNTKSGVERSNRYNNKIKQYTLQYAIKEQIINKSSPFKDIIQKKYNENLEKINKFYNIN